MMPLFTVVKDFLFLVGYVTSYNLFPEALKPEEEEIYLKRYLEENDGEAKKVLIERNLRLVAHISKKYTSPYVEQDDLISIGTIGLIKAINSYKGGKGVKLATYAARCIENEILMYLRSTKKISQEISLNDPLGHDKEGNEITFIDIIESENLPVEDELDLKMKIKSLYRRIGAVLKDREKLIIELRFGLNGRDVKTQNEIAEELGISRSYVSRIETKAIQKLNQEFKAEND